MIGNQLGSFAAGEDIEELASDVFVALWQAGRTLQTEHLRGWLGRVARNQAISFLRKQRLQLVPDEDFFTLGLSGRPDSAAKRAALLQALSLPAHMSANALLQAVNVLFSREEFLARFVEP